tara:strand:+ start:1411 stop:2712 length:1302 start_codon:yes stop_codon:yes gene_type:complete
MFNNILIKKKKVAEYFFLIGIFFLPSALFIASIFLLIAGIWGFFFQDKNYFEDNWNKSFFLCGVLILINSILQNFILPEPYSEIWKSNLSIVGILNWIPFFLLFWGFQPFLDTSQKRKITSLVIISGTFPVLISGIGQYYFNWVGPIEIMGGLIIWYQRPLDVDCLLCGLTGLFNNANYAGSWFNLVWPFCIALVLQKSQNLISKSISISFLISIGVSIFLTSSRNAWAGLLITIPLVIGGSSFTWYVPTLLFLIFITFLSSLEIFAGEFQDILRNIIPSQIWNKIGSERFSSFDISRLDLFKSAIGFIALEPLMGIGAASFSTLYEIENGQWKGHSHNLFIELALSYGLPVAILLSGTILNLVFKSSKILLVKKSEDQSNFYFERAWWASLFFFLISQNVDIQYFDGKIILMTWVLLAGLKNILDNDLEPSN